MAVIDVPAVGGIDARAFGPGGWPERAFRAELRENRLARYFVVADANSDALLGYVGCWLLADAVHLVTIGVDPVYQRQGIGELLVLRVLDLALEAGVPAVTLECRASNEAAQALYGKYGFEIVGRRRRYYADKEDALIMTRVGVGGAAVRDELAASQAAHARKHAIELSRIGG